MSAGNLTFGQRLRLHRERRGMTRPVLGGLVGRSPQWVKSVERGEILTPRLPMLIRLAEVLGVTDLQDLTGDQSVPVASVTNASHPATPAITEALLRPARSYDVDPATLDVPERVAQCLHLWQRSPAVESVGPLLPGLITDARAAVLALDGTARRRAYADLALVYHLTQWQLAYGPAAEMVWLAAGQGMAAAESSDNPVAIATAAWSCTLVYRDGNQLDAAETVATETARLLNPEAGGGNALALWGKMHMANAHTHAKAGRAGQAWREFDQAAKAERALGYPHSWGPRRREPTLYEIAFTSSTGLSAVELEVDLFQPGAAIRRAGALDLSTAPPSKRADVHLHVARANVQSHEPERALEAIERAAHESVDVARRLPFVRQAVTEYRGRSGDVGARARNLALTIGLTD